MRKVFLTGLCLFSLLITGYSLKVDTSELNSGVNKIDFIDYKGALAAGFTPGERFALGVKLADGVTNDGKPFESLGFSVIHAEDTNLTNGLDADIFMILKTAQVTHISRIRSVLSGYLSRKYGYDTNESAAIATFLTYYNATYRSNMDYFSSRYKPVVLNKIDIATAGIAIKYSDWAGKTKMLIPLISDELAGGVQKLSTGEVAKSNVIEAMRQETNMALPERKQMVEVQKKEIAQDKQGVVEKQTEAATAQKQAAETKQQVAAAVQTNEVKKQEIAKQEQVIVQQKEAAKTIDNPTNKAAAEQQIAQAEQKVAQDKTAAAVADTNITQLAKTAAVQQVAADAKQQEAQKAAQTVAAKETAVKQQEAQIKTDQVAVDAKTNPAKVQADLTQQQAQIDQQKQQLDQREADLKKNPPEKTIMGGKLYYLKIKQFMPEGQYSNELMVIDTSTRKVEMVSPFSNIGGHKYDVRPEGILVIGYQYIPGGKQDVTTENRRVIVGYPSGPKADEYRLVLLDTNTLMPVIYGKDNVFWRSFVEFRNDSTYAVLNDAGKYYLGRFDSNIVLQAKSPLEVDPDTQISFAPDALFVSTPDRKILALKLDDLSLIETIEP